MNHNLYVSMFASPPVGVFSDRKILAHMEFNRHAATLRLSIGAVSVSIDTFEEATKDADMDALVTALEGACLLWRERKRSGPNGEEERSSEAPSASCAVPKVSMRPVTATDAAAAAFDRLGNAMLEPPCGC